MHTSTLCAARLRVVGHALTLLLMRMALVTILLGWANCVYAHASLVSSQPPEGALLSQAPDALQLSFNEAISPLKLQLIEPDGTLLPLDKVHTQDSHLDISLPTLKQQGSYALSWRVISADGHPVGGSLLFSVGTQDAKPVAPRPAMSPARDILIWATRVANYIGLFFGVGLAACHVLLWSRDQQRRPIIKSLLLLGISATLLNIGLLGLDALDLPMPGLFSMEPWRVAWSTSSGTSALLMLAGLISAALCLRLDSAYARKLAALLALGFTGLALAASGHASNAPPAWLARPAVWIHALAITLWLGSLLPLAWSLNTPSTLLPLQYFSRGIPLVILMLLISGATLITLQFTSPASLWTTQYGWVLSVKLVLVAAMMGLGAYNRYRLTAPALMGEVSAQQGIRRIITLECVLALTVLAVAALWRFTPPPRALNITPITPELINTHIHSDAAIVDLNIQPSADGNPASLSLSLYQTDMAPLSAQEVDVVFFNQKTGIEPIRFTAQPASDQRWQVSDLSLPPQQHWQIRIDILISDFDRIRVTSTFDKPH